MSLQPHSAYNVTDGRSPRRQANNCRQMTSSLSSPGSPCLANNNNKKMVSSLRNNGDNIASTDQNNQVINIRVSVLLEAWYSVLKESKC